MMDSLLYLFGFCFVVCFVCSTLRQQFFHSTVQSTTRRSRPRPEFIDFCVALYPPAESNIFIEPRGLRRGFISMFPRLGFFDLSNACPPRYNHASFSQGNFLSLQFWRSVQCNPWSSSTGTLTGDPNGTLFPYLPRHTTGDIYCRWWRLLSVSPQ